MLSRNVFRFSLLVLSSIGFSVGLFYARVLGDEVILSEAIKLQSYVVILSFILQLGYRAAIRKEIYAGQTAVVNTMKVSLYDFLMLTAFIGFGAELYLEQNYYIALSALVAWVTFRLTSSVAENDDVEFILFSMAVFLASALPTLFIASYTFDVEKSALYIESAVVALFLCLLPNRLLHFDYQLSVKALLEKIYQAQYYQLGSGIIYLSVFFLAQSVLAGDYDIDHLQAYADVQIISGMFSLVAGKMLLLFERRLYGSTQVRFKVFLAFYLFFFMFSCLVVMLINYFSAVEWLFLSVICFVLMGRAIMGYIVQYYMGVLLVGVVTLCYMILLSAYSLYGFDQGVTVMLLIPLLLLVCFCFFSNLFCEI